MTEHIIHPRVYVGIAAALLILLAATVMIAEIDLGPWNVVAALVIACIKALLVILYFMEVRYSSRLTWLVVIAGFAWLVLLIGLTLSDVLNRHPLPFPLT
ncbi:MAG TPA: cytochrome C oxidase subunit IV family protein [Candidatus Polarisedimenticolia bacterium]|nr:cytochrome C oxidase subunit IV family protein [Candidatus Polarisedimenticolia bacterium]